MTIARAAISTLVVLSWISIGCAQAQQEGSRERELLKRAQSALQRSEQDKAKLQEDKAKLEQEKSALAGKLKAAERTKRDLVAARKKEAEQQKTLDDTRQHLDASKAKIAELEAQLKDMTAALKESEDRGRQLAAQGKDLEQKLSQQREIIGRQTQIVQACDEKNAKLATLSDELLKKYHDKSFWDALAQKEPFTGIKEVRIQNVLQEYREKAEALKVEKAEVKQ